jgi:hypothetical protein
MPEPADPWAPAPSPVESAPAAADAATPAESVPTETLPAEPVTAESTPAVADEATPVIPMELPAERSNLTYSSSESTNAPGSGASSADVSVREDGTHVRRVAAGEQYVKGGGDAFASAGRNDPCPCGSEKKFKKCHGAPTHG